MRVKSQMSSLFERALNPMAVIHDFGAAGNGVANDTAAFNKALASGKAVFIPAGTYLVHDVGLTGALAGSQLIGAGIGSTILKHDGTAASNVITLTSTFSHTLVIEGILVNGNNTATYGISANEFSLRFADVVTVNTLSDGWNLQGFSILLENCRADHAAGHGFNVNAGICATLLNCYAENIGAASYGFFVGGGFALFLGCNGIDSGGGVIDCSNFSTVSILQQNFESFTIDALVVGAGHVTVKDSVFLNNTTANTTARKAINNNAGDLMLEGEVSFQLGGGQSWTNGLPLHATNPVTMIQNTFAPEVSFYDDVNGGAVGAAIMTPSNRVFFGQGMTLNRAFVTDLKGYNIGNANAEGFRNITYQPAKPTAGAFNAGDFVQNSAGGSQIFGTGTTKYLLWGWARLTTGAAHVADVDWDECRIPIHGNAATA